MATPGADCRMSSVWKRIQDYCAGILIRRREYDRPVDNPVPGRPQQRREPRVPTQEVCDFALTHASDPDEVICEEGAGMTVNVSRSGMQLLMGVAPARGQVLEVHLGSSGVNQSVSLVEVRWTKPVRADLQDQLHLVGCRLTFGPLRYWAV